MNIENISCSNTNGLWKNLLSDVFCPSDNTELHKINNACTLVYVCGGLIKEDTISAVTMRKTSA